MLIFIAAWGRQARLQMIIYAIIKLNFVSTFFYTESISEGVK